MVSALLLLPNCLRLDCRVFGLVLDGCLLQLQTILNKQSNVILEFLLWICILTEVFSYPICIYWLFSRMHALLVSLSVNRLVLSSHYFFGVFELLGLAAPTKMLC